MMWITQSKANAHPMLATAPQHSRDSRCFEDEKKEK